MLKKISLNSNKIKKEPKKYMLTIFLGILTIITGVYAYNAGQDKKKINYKKELDQVVATVDGTDISLKDFAFYVAYEENIVEEQAYVYDPSDTNKYWNLHIDGEFVRIAARNSAVDMAIHDEIFYEMAMAEEISLNNSERKCLENSQMDFWSDLTDYDKQKELGIKEEDIDAAMEKVAIAQKYQEIFAELNNKDVEEFDFSGEAYKALLEETEYQINTEVLEKITFGNVTLEH